MQCEFLPSIHDLSAADWDALCPDGYPFMRHAFLAALEDSGSTTAQRGWQPRHLVVREGQTIRAILPLYMKNHSWGEYVFDHAWADAYQRYGLAYYPKLVNAVPFTPCTGPRLLTGDVVPDEALMTTLTEALENHCLTHHLSGWHSLFPEKSLSSAWDKQGAMTRIGCQFHWFNRGYSTFTDFVGQMNSRKRKMLLKERRQVVEQGFTFVAKNGFDIREEEWDFFHALYQTTYMKRSGHGGYLTRDFFQRIGKNLPEHSLMISALHQERTIAAALFFVGGDTLYGRYWGCTQEYEFLHFETCYYQGIDYAIAHGLQRFDGGAQGEHKLARGFEPMMTQSSHWLADQAFREPVRRFLAEEQQGVLAYAQEAKKHLPFKQAD